MRQNRDLVLDWIGLSEGGYVNHPRDPGGATDRGITQATYDAWNRAHGRPLKPVRGISKEEAREILSMQYFDTVKFDQLPAGVDYAVADYGVNSGPGRAAKVLQRVLGVDDDGVIGVMTLAALAQRNPTDVIKAICDERMRFLRGLDTWDDFGRGWTVRVVGRAAGAQDDDIGVIDRATKLARGAAAIPAPSVVAQGKGRESDVRANSAIGDLTTRVEGDDVSATASALTALEARVTESHGTTGAFSTTPVQQNVVQPTNPIAAIIALITSLFRRKQ